ncbi:MAG: hypothetical protein K2X78_09170 [Burkholderiaceae bacterium]|nr:hypothetical protein [Burkholderiaceae bacterium]
MNAPYDALDAIALGLPRPGPQLATRAQVDELMLTAFFLGRPARSSAYKLGVSAKLRLVLQRERLVCPYAQGSAEFDAFFAGAEEGSVIANGYMESLA